MSQGLIYARAAMSTNFYIDKGKVLTSIMLFQREVLDLSSNSIVTILHLFLYRGDLMAQTWRGRTRCHLCLFLSDHEILSVVEAELVFYLPSCAKATGCPPSGPARLRRLGQ